MAKRNLKKAWTHKDKIGEDRNHILEAGKQRIK